MKSNPPDLAKSTIHTIDHAARQSRRPRPGDVRTMMPVELPLFLDHLLRLDPESRRDRFSFNGYVDDSVVAEYAVSCEVDGTIVVAYIERTIVRGAAELRPAARSDESAPEIAISVEANARRQGIGSTLLRHLIAEARWRGYRKLGITADAKNKAVHALARKVGADLIVRQNEIKGTIDVRPQPHAELVMTAIDAPLVAAQAMIKFHLACWNLAFNKIGVRNRGPKLSLPRCDN